VGNVLGARAARIFFPSTHLVHKASPFPTPLAVFYVFGCGGLDLPEDGCPTVRFDLAVLGSRKHLTVRLCVFGSLAVGRQEVHQRLFPKVGALCHVDGFGQRVFAPPDRAGRDVDVQGGVFGGPDIEVLADGLEHLLDFLLPMPVDGEGRRDDLD
jgi:hypothetical protein